MQRIDADEIAAGGGDDLGEAGEVLEIADAPVALRAQAIDLAGDAPAAAVAQPVGQVAGDALRRLHDIGIGGTDRPQAGGDGGVIVGGDAKRLQREAQGMIGGGDDRPQERLIVALDAGERREAVEVVAHFGAVLPPIMVSPARSSTVRPSSSSVSPTEWVRPGGSISPRPASTRTRQ